MLARCVILLCAVLTARGFNLGPTDVVFHLFTRANPTSSQPLLPNPNSIATSFFSLQRLTIFTIHSYTEIVSGNFNAHLVTAHINTEDVNVIAVDWGSVSTTYSVGLANAPQVGAVIATFINILVNDFTYDINQIRIVGVGLGGHIAGIAARRTIGEIPHIIALDPSLVGWTHHPEKLHPDDADVVEVLHVTAGSYGYDYQLGDLDFYANGGSQQPACGSDLACSHILGYVYYAESINADRLLANRFLGTTCNSYAEAIANNCTGVRDVIFGGIATKRGISGIRLFRTNGQAPFAQG